MQRQPSKGPTQRQLRVGEQLRHIVADVMQRGHFHDEALLDAGITVTEVRCSPDLKHATAYVLNLGENGVSDETLEALNADHQVFQKEINKQSNLKFTPRVKFVRDDSFEEAQKIEDLLREVHIPEEDNGAA